MPRTSRVVVPGMVHHVVQRAIRRLNAFRDDEDRVFYRKVFVESRAMHGLRLRAYSLMTNHVHYIAIPEQADSICRTFHRANTIYANWFNEKYGFVGHLWQERPFSCVVSEGRVMNAIRYVENNPVRAHMVGFAPEYRWSSARAHCWGEPYDFLGPDEAIALPGWQEWLDRSDDLKIEDLIRICTFVGRPCGDEAFLNQIEGLTGRKLRPKKRGRPRKVEGSEIPKLDFSESE
jgi:putative transposase